MENLIGPQGVTPLSDQPLPGRGAPSWSYGEAFSRNLGLVSAAEQERLRREARQRR